MKTAHDCKNYVHNRLLVLRNIFGLLSKDKFDDLFEMARESDREKLIAAIQAFDYEEIQRIVRELSRMTLETMTMKDLRDLARRYGIRNYSFMAKGSLLSAIYQREQAIDRNDTGDVPATSGIGTSSETTQ